MKLPSHDIDQRLCMYEGSIGFEAFEKLDTLVDSEFPIDTRSRVVIAAAKACNACVALHDCQNDVNLYLRGQEPQTIPITVLPAVVGSYFLEADGTATIVGAESPYRQSRKKRCIVKINEEQASLKPDELDILKYLAEHPDQELSRNHLIAANVLDGQAVWRYKRALIKLHLEYPSAINLRTYKRVNFYSFRGGAVMNVVGRETEEGEISQQNFLANSDAIDPQYDQHNIEGANADDERSCS